MIKVKNLNSLINDFKNMSTINKKKLLAAVLILMAVGFYIYKNNVSGSDCILKYVSKAKSNVDAQFVQKACFQLASNSSKTRAQGKCILHEVLKVNNDNAARAVYLACLSKGSENDKN